MKHEYVFDYIHIIQIEASEIFKSIKKKTPLVIKNSRDEFDEHFKELFAPNLDLLYLNSIGKLKVEKLLDEQFTYDFVSVTFDKLENPQKKQGLTLLDIRKYLYENGFVLNKKEYVRYKRAAGSARSGSCLFIKKPLYKEMSKWSNLDVKEEDNNLVSFEAYRALSLSGLIDTIEISPKQILFVEDYEEITLPKEEVARVFIKDNGLAVEKAKCDISNNIWDGEGLLDESLFEKAGYKKKGMMLLRNRFFKSCVFNTKLQRWFRNNGITNVNQLQGITLATKVSDIKMVVTTSSLKYLKMVPGGFSKENIKKWCDQIDSTFGIVKTDKPTHLFNGDLVETNYQLLNTLHLTDRKVAGLLQWNIDYINKIRDLKNTPEYSKLYLKGEFDPNEYEDESIDLEDTEEELVDESIYTFKKLACDILLDINKDIIKTSAYKYFIYDETVNSFAYRLYGGHVMVEGTYATLFGNPYELLLKTVGKFEGKSIFLHKNEVCTSFFKDNVQIVGARSPHVTMGNLFCATNKRIPELEKWFNLTREIIIVDAIENNIQHRLNGADYDSDSMLITNNPFIVEAAFKHYNRFLVPYADIPPDKENERKPLYELDDKIANNRVGLITNYSQLLNSYYWDKVNSKGKKDLSELYLVIAKLAVFSGLEIDSAKRSFPFDAKSEMSSITEYLQSLKLIFSEGVRKPLFFYKIDFNKAKIGQIDSFVRNNHSKKFKTAMDYIWENVWKEELLKTSLRDKTTFSTLTKGRISQNKRGGKGYEIVDNIIDKHLIPIYQYFSSLQENDDGYKLKRRKYIDKINKEVDKLKRHLGDAETIRMVIRRLDKRQNGDENEKGKYSNLFLIFFYLICKYNEDTSKEFLGSIFNSDLPLNSLVSIRYKEGMKYSLFGKYGYKVEPYSKLINAIFDKKVPKK